MPYYGHHLFFGTLLDPVADPPERAVELARLSESLGYDAVVLRDEPGRRRPARCLDHADLDRRADRAHLARRLWWGGCTGGCRP